MKGLLAFAALAAFNMATAQKTMDLKDLKRITLGSDIKLTMVKGSENKLVLNDGEDLEVKNNYGNLKLEGDGNATLYYKNELEGITIGSDAEIRGNDEIRGKSFQLTAGSDSKVALKLNVQELQITAGSDSEVSLDGKANTMKATIGSDAQFRVEGLSVADVTINLGSDAEGIINANGTVNATVASDSSLKIYGKPKEVNEVKGDDSEITIMR